MPNSLLECSRFASLGLATPSRPVSVILGKRAALVMPILAVAAARVCSACRISGRRCSRSEGRPAGTSGGIVCSVSRRPRAIGAGFFPSNTLNSFSFCTICRSSSATLADTLARSASNWSASSRETTPPRKRCWASATVSSHDCRVRRAMSNCRSSCSRSK